MVSHRTVRQWLYITRQTKSKSIHGSSSILSNVQKSVLISIHESKIYLQRVLSLFRSRVLLPKYRFAAAPLSRLELFSGHVEFFHRDAEENDILGNI